MASKKFCDVCDQPADDLDRTLELELHTGKLVSVKQAGILVKFMVNFVKHPGGFGGPPDLCACCRLIAAEEIVRVLKARVSRSAIPHGIPAPNSILSADDMAQLLGDGLKRAKTEEMGD